MITDLYFRAQFIIDRAQLTKNIQLWHLDKPQELKFIYVAKNKGCGAGLEYMSKLAIKYGAWQVAVANLDEARQLINFNIPLFILGERAAAEIPWLIDHNCAIQVQSPAMANLIDKYAYKNNKKANIHIKIDTGLGRYGFNWDNCQIDIAYISSLQNIKIIGFFSHLAMSDELDKSYAQIQNERFLIAKNQCQKYLPLDCVFHLCNSGGYLDLPDMHYQACRIGILFTGNYPSAVCRRIKIAGEELKSAIKLVSKVSYLKNLKKGDYVGYGMHYQAQSSHQVAIIPIGYGDGYPRLRNVGSVLIQGAEIAIIGGVAMDCIMVNTSILNNCQVGDEVVLLGCQQNKEINAYQIAKLANTVNYQIITNFSTRLEVIYRN